KRIVFAADVPIVIQHEFNRRTEPLALRPFASERNLLLRDVESANFDTVALRHVDGEASPATSRLNDTFAWFEAHLAADVVHLRNLGLVERRSWSWVVGAGIRHRLTQPKRIKLVADV